MKHTDLIFPAVVGLFCLHLSCQSPSPNDTSTAQLAQLNTSPELLVNNNILGRFSFSESVGESAGGIPINFFHTLQITESAGVLVGSYHIDGYQTMTRLRGQLRPVNGKQWQLIFEDFEEDDLFRSDRFKPKALLCTLRLDGNQLSVSYPKNTPVSRMEGRTVVFERE
jgi:hypothetical protein